MDKQAKCKPAFAINVQLEDTKRDQTGKTEAVSTGC